MSSHHIACDLSSSGTAQSLCEGTRTGSGPSEFDWLTCAVLLALLSRPLVCFYWMTKLNEGKSFISDANLVNGDSLDHVILTHTHQLIDC